MGRHIEIPDTVDDRLLPGTPSAGHVTRTRTGTLVITLRSPIMKLVITGAAPTSTPHADPRDSLVDTLGGALTAIGQHLRRVASAPDVQGDEGRVELMSTEICAENPALAGSIEDATLAHDGPGTMEYRSRPRTWGW